MLYIGLELDQCRLSTKWMMLDVLAAVGGHGGGASWK